MRQLKQLVLSVASVPDTVQAAGVLQTHEEDKEHGDCHTTFARRSRHRDGVQRRGVVTAHVLGVASEGCQEAMWVLLLYVLIWFFETRSHSAAHTNL